MAYLLSQTLQTRDSSLGDGLSYSFLSISTSMHTYSQGGTLFFSIRGIRVSIWGLRFYKKIIFGACELQLKKNSILSAENYSS